MNPIKVTQEPTITFIYGICTDDKLSEVVEALEKDKCEFLQAVPGFVMPPQNALSLPGARQQPVPILKILARTTKTNHAKMVADKNMETIMRPGVN